MLKAGRAAGQGPLARPTACQAFTLRARAQGGKDSPTRRQTLDKSLNAADAKWSFWEFHFFHNPPRLPPLRAPRTDPSGS